MTNSRKIPNNNLPILPPKEDLESKEVLKKAISANKALAKLQGWTFTQSNPLLLLQSIALQEAKSSSEIENVVTTNDELYQAFSTPTDAKISPAAKEVMHYKEALWYGYQKLHNEGYPLTINVFIKLFQIIKQRTDGIRNIPGTVLKNSLGEVVYTPPDNQEDILRLLSNLEAYINTDNDQVDSLIKLAVIHYQFESIHPFPDGNGRVGRILNILYLIHKNLLVFPILYLSRYIIQHKTTYYKSLRQVTENGDWIPWILYMLDGIEVTAEQTLCSIQKIYRAQEDVIQILKTKAPSIYSKELAELLFEQPYCKISFLVERGLAKPQTASKYLKTLSELGIVTKIKKGRENYYINRRLWDILTTIQ